MLACAWYQFLAPCGKRTANCATKVSHISLYSKLMTESESFRMFLANTFGSLDKGLLIVDQFLWNSLVREFLELRTLFHAQILAGN